MYNFWNLFRAHSITIAAFNSDRKILNWKRFILLILAHRTVLLDSSFFYSIDCICSSITQCYLHPSCERLSFSIRRSLEQFRINFRNASWTRFLISDYIAVIEHRKCSNSLCSTFWISFVCKRAKTIFISLRLINDH